MNALFVIVGCLLSAAPAPQAAPTAQPSTRPVYYVSRYSTTYHQGDCTLLPKVDRQVAKPEDLRSKTPCRLCVRDPAGNGVAPATQPATGLTKYYSLVKNEFIKQPNGSIELISPDLRTAIAHLRATAAEEQKLIEQDIAELTKEIQAADAVRKSATKQERAEKAEARRHDARADQYGLQYDQGYTYTYRHHSYYEEDEADAARSRAREHRDNADRAKGDVNAMRADLLRLKKASATLAAVASPLSRNLPPKPFWKDLPPAQQAQLERVGINPDQLKSVLARLGQTEDSFVALAKTLEKDARTPDQLAKLLREYFDQQMGYRRPTTQPAPTTAPAVAAKPEPPLVAMYTEGGRRFQPSVILLIWRSGRVVWSEDAIKGGPPYREATIDPDAVDNALAAFEQQGMFTQKSLNDIHYGPDSSYTVIRIADGARQLKMQSWHELFEQNAKLVVTHSGVMALPAGKTRDEILAGEPQDYRDYLAAWQAIRTTFKKLLPANGAPLKTVEFDRR